jgi:hypothetical protein
MLKEVRCSNTIRIIQLHGSGFQDYQMASNTLNYSGVSYVKVKVLGNFKNQPLLMSSNGLNIKRLNISNMF